MRVPSQKHKAQVALEFLIVYSFVLLIFILVFSVVSTQRAATLDQQEYSLLQLQSQNIASYIDQAQQAGTGYSATMPLISGLSNNYYNLSISSTGVVITGTKVGGQSIDAYAFSHAKSFIINGTPLASSANGVVLYSIPTSRGSIKISNFRGTIYINAQQPVITSLVQSAVLTQIASVKAPIFNGMNNYITTPASTRYSSAAQYAVSFWFLPREYVESQAGATSTFLVADGNGFNWRFVWNNPVVFGAPSTLEFKSCAALPACPVGVNGASATLNSLNQWYFVTGVYDGSNYNLYINGTLVASSAGTSTGRTAASIYIGGGALCPIGGCYHGYLNGSIADIQYYNSSISAANVMQLYQEGIDGAPLGNLDALQGWWPLNGNPNDYSAFGNDGAPVNNTNYQTVVQADAQAYLLSGDAASNALIGFSSNGGYMNGSCSCIAARANSNGTATALMTSEGMRGSGVLHADVFNGNLTSIANLSGWWPLDTGSGNVIYDLSGGSNNGNFYGQWDQAANQTNFAAALFPGGGNGLSGNTLYGFVTVNSSQALLNIINTRSFTVVAWIYYNGPTPTHSQGIFGDWAGVGGFQLLGYDNCAGCQQALVVNGSSVSFPGNLNSFPTNRWEMVAAEYDGNNGTATLYLNNTVYAYNNMPRGLTLLSSNSYYIGDDASQPTGTDTFNGMITNLQFYDTYLSQQQIDSLYSADITATPAGTGGLLGWWPLLSSGVDYSSNRDNGDLRYNISFVNSASNSTAHMAAPLFATFNGAANAIIPSSKRLGITGKLSVSLWFSSANGSTSTFDSELVSSGISSYGFDLQLCGNAACGLTGIHSAIGDGSGLLSDSVDYPFNFNKNVWYNVVESFNGSSWTIYLNGIRVSSGAYSGTPSLFGGSRSLTLGSGNSGAHFTGQIADLQVYNTTLTQQEAEQIYVQGLPSQYSLNVSID